MTMAPERPTGRRTAPQPADTESSPSARPGARCESALITGGEILRFSCQVIRSLPEVRVHWTEILRQAGDPGPLAAA